MQGYNRYIQEAGQGNEDSGGYKVYKDWKSPGYWKGTGRHIKRPALILAATAILFLPSGKAAPYLIVAFGAAPYHWARWAMAGTALICTLSIVKSLLGKAAANRAVVRKYEEMVRQEEEKAVRERKETPALDAAVRLNQNCRRHRDPCYVGSIMDCSEDLYAIHDLGLKYQQLMQDNEDLRKKFQQTFDPVVHEIEKEAANRADCLLNYINIGDREAVADWSEKTHEKNIAKIRDMEKLLRALADYEADSAEFGDVDVAPYTQGVRSTFED